MPLPARRSRLAAVTTAAALTVGIGIHVPAGAGRSAARPWACGGRGPLHRHLEGCADRDLRRRGQGSSGDPADRRPQGQREVQQCRAVPRVPGAPAGPGRGPGGRRGGQALRGGAERLHHQPVSSPGQEAGQGSGGAVGDQGHPAEADRRQEPGRLLAAEWQQRRLAEAGRPGGRPGVESWSAFSTRATGRRARPSRAARSAPPRPPAPTIRTGRTASAPRSG